MTVDHYPSVLRALCARLDHQPHLDQPRAYNQISSRDYDTELNTNQELHCEHETDDAPAFQVSIQRPDFDLVYSIFSCVSIQRPDFDLVYSIFSCVSIQRPDLAPSSTGQTAIRRHDANFDLIQRRPDKNPIADPPNHRHQLRARSRNTR